MSASESQMQDLLATSWHDNSIQHATLGSNLIWLDRILAMDQVAMECVFMVWFTAETPRTVHTLCVGFVVREQQIGAFGSVQETIADRVVKDEVVQAVRAAFIRPTDGTFNLHS